MTNKKPIVYPYIPNSVPAIKDQMLHAVGAESADDFYESVPEALPFPPDDFTGQRQLGQPALEIVGEPGAGQERCVGEQPSGGHAHAGDSVLELFDDVLLVTALVGQVHVHVDALTAAGTVEPQLGQEALGVELVADLDEELRLAWIVDAAAASCRPLARAGAAGFEPANGGSKVRCLT